MQSLEVNLLIASPQANSILCGSIPILEYPSTLNKPWKKYFVVSMHCNVSRSNVVFSSFSYLSTNDLTAAKKMDFLICEMSNISFLGGSPTSFLALSFFFTLVLVRLTEFVATSPFTLTPFTICLTIPFIFGNFSLRYDIA